MNGLFALSAKHSAHFAAMLMHARNCRVCTKPILDAEGQPSGKATACANGAMLLDRLRELEAHLFREPMTVAFTRTR